MKTLTDKKLLGYCEVDSGQLLITDPCYLRKEWDNTTDNGNAEDVFNEKNRGKYSYAGCCIATVGEDSGGQLHFKEGNRGGAGVAISSGYGDGLCPVYAEYDKEGRVSKITIETI